MQNIFDIFNMRKEGLTSIVEGAQVDSMLEGVEIEEVEYETLDVAMEALNEIVQEATQSHIEFQGAAYLEDLVLESMMYENFNEEKINVAMEATIKERAVKAKEAIKRQWAKITAWFAATMKAIANYFTSGEDLVAKNKSAIPDAMKACKAKVKIYAYQPVSAAVSKCTDLVDKAKVAGASKTSKDAVLAAVGAKDRAGVADIVKGYFISGKEPVEKAVYQLNPAIAMDYAGNKKAILDSIKKSKATVDADFKEILGLIEKAGEGDKSGNQVAVFNFATSLKTAIINAEIRMVKKGASDNLAIIRKALAAKSGAGTQPIKDKKESKAMAKSFEPKQNGFEIESADASLESLAEIEFIDEVENTEAE